MRKPLIIAACLACLVGAGGVLAWHFWPGPPPTTADQVLDAVMQSDPADMSEEELAVWMKDVAEKAERLPPHELQKLVERALSDEKLKARFESLAPEERQKLAELVSEEQRARMMATMAVGMVAMLKALPAPARKVMIQQMRERGEAYKGKGKGERHEMTKERVARWLSGTTPTQRAEMVRAMRDMRKMMEEAGFKD